MSVTHGVPGARHGLWAEIGRVHDIAEQHVDVFASLAPDWTGTPTELAAACAKLAAI